jgi:hypothetical protein
MITVNIATDWIKHNIARTIGVVIISSLLIGMPILAYKFIYNKGYSAGYTKCLKDNPPTIITGGTTHITNNATQKEPFAQAKFKLWFIKVGTETSF